MAKRRNKVIKTTTPDEPRVRAGVNLNVWLPEDVMRAFEELREEDARTKTAQVLVIFKDYLKRRGKWPPPAHGQG
jgi:hypothetical protein